MNRLNDWLEKLTNELKGHAKFLAFLEAERQLAPEHESSLKEHLETMQAIKESWERAKYHRHMKPELKLGEPSSLAADRDRWFAARKKFFEITSEYNEQSREES